jgi:hypothetical protein
LKAKRTTAAVLNSVKEKAMKSKLFLTALVLSVVLVLQSCEVVGGIFKAGAATGIIAVLAVVAIIIFLISKSGKR